MQILFLGRTAKHRRGEYFKGKGKYGKLEEK